ncbi:MAG: hypothetical protein WAM30_05860, partial [Candidatus Dormiibacterota bacterium]
MRRAPRQPTIPWSAPAGAWQGAAPVAWNRGISLIGHDLWLDPQVVRARAFVSHAHSDHARRHVHAILTAETLELLPEARRPRGTTVVELGVPLPLEGATVTLHDAGHMLGAAQLQFARDGWRLLYTGDCKLRRADGTRTPIPQADVLVLESTYGRPHFRFPDPGTVVGAISVWARRTLALGSTPVLLAHATGKAQ